MKTERKTGRKGMPQRLLFHGYLLFLLGLASGLIAYALENPRMGVSAHLEAIMNGLFLIALGLSWGWLSLSDRQLAVCFWTALVGSYANWAIPLFSAIVGASQPMLVGAGFEAEPWQEALLTASPIIGVLPPIVCCSLAVWGLRSRAALAKES